jgi:predicted kinase
VEAVECKSIRVNLAFSATGPAQATVGVLRTPFTVVSGRTTCSRSATRLAENAELRHMSDARLILTCGLPGAGKTALAKQLAANRNAVRLTKDEWLTALGSSPWDTPTREKVEHELWRLAQEILRLGVSVVLDFGLWARIERDEMRSAARSMGVAVELHFLDLPPDELWRRIEARNWQPPWDSHPIRRADFDGWLAIFQAPDPAELALFDPPPDSN